MSAILIVDDEQFILAGLGDYFRSVGYIVHCAQDLEHAMRLLQNIRYELVISDIRLTRNGGQGFRMVEYVKQHWPGTATILLTGAGLELASEARQAGADLVLEKPFLLDKLGATAIGLLANRKPPVDKPADAN